MISLILLVFAFVLAFIAAFFREPVEPHRARLIAAALAFFFLACILGHKVFADKVGLGQKLPTPEWLVAKGF